MNNSNRPEKIERKLLLGESKGRAQARKRALKKTLLAKKVK